ncbi:MAG: 4Fe-4S ferredoxin iron-sulfur binding protein [Clostridia bacterium]|jgi:Fe-S-cluster-containing hydrogenase component 2|nr:4Fe-4S ferredoxin iron-sulfur binding protein [Clostridia bacterium]
MVLEYKESACSGCRACQLVCALSNFKEINPAKAALAIEGQFPSPGKYTVHVCNQCGACAEACPAEAIYLDEGRYLIDYEKCISCMSCVDACPNKVMMTHKNLDMPFKCNNCGQCVAICPRDALTFRE